MDRALLIGVILPNVYKVDVKNHLDELKMLAQTANVDILGKVTQKVRSINPAFYIGKGKNLKTISSL